jgi:hypothetical protein
MPSWEPVSTRARLMVMRKQLATVILVAAAVAGCGSSSSSVTLGSSGSSPAPVPSGLPAPSGSPSPDPLITHAPSAIVPGRVLPTTPPASVADRKRLISLPWEFMRLANGGKQIQISLDVGGCTSFDFVEVQQGSSSVEITTWGTNAATTHTVCPAFEAILRGTVTLDAPLGSRKLFHGPVSRGRIIPMVQISPMS